MLDERLELGGIENLVLTYFIDYDFATVEIQEPEWQQLIPFSRRCVMGRWMEDRVRH